MESQLLINLRNNASAFKKSAERSLEHRSLPNGKFEFLAVPTVVNFAFSIELYLKFLLNKNKTSIKSHNLLDLFNLLDLTIKQEIIDLSNYDKDKFELLLNEHAKAFVEWRYLHEINESIHVDINFMMKMTESVESIVNRS